MKNPFKNESISYFSKSLTNEGKVKFSGTLRIDGIFEGEIEGQYPIVHDSTSGNMLDLLIVGKSGSVKGKVSVQMLVVEGKISGDIFVTEKAVILSSAEFKGSLITPIIRVEEGAKIEGSINDIKKAGIESKLNFVSRNDANEIEKSPECCDIPVNRETPLMFPF